MSRDPFLVPELGRFRPGIPFPSDDWKFPGPPCGTVADEPGLVVDTAKQVGRQLFVVMDRRNPFEIPRDEDGNPIVEVPMEPPSDPLNRFEEVIGLVTSDYGIYAKGFYTDAITGLLVQELILAVATSGTANVAKWAVTATTRGKKLVRILNNARKLARAATIGRLSDAAVPGLNALRKVGYAIDKLALPLKALGAGQRRVVTRVLREVEDATGLPVADQRALVGIVARTDADGDTTDTLDEIAEEGRLEDLTGLVRCARAGSSRLHPRGAVAPGAGTADCIIDADERTVERVASDLVDARTEGEISPEEFRRISDALVDGPADSAALVRLLDTGDETTMRFVANTDPDALKGYTDLLERNGGSRSIVDLREFAQQTGADGSRLVNNLDPDTAIALKGGSNGYDEVSGVTTTDEYTQVVGTIYHDKYDDPVDVDTNYVEDRDTFIANHNRGDKDWDDLDSNQRRGEYFEESIAPDILEEEYGYEVICAGDDCGTGDNGIDVIAWDPDSEDIVIIESKYSGGDSSVVPGLAGDGRDTTDNGDKDAMQMTERWVIDSWDERGNDLDFEASDEVRDQIIDKYGGDSIEGALDIGISTVGDYRREWIVMKDNDNGGVLSPQGADPPEGSSTDRRYMDELVGDDGEPSSSEVHYFKVGESNDADEGRITGDETTMVRPPREQAAWDGTTGGSQTASRPLPIVGLHGPVDRGMRVTAR